MEVQVTSWSSLNPRFWAPQGFGVTDLVLPNTSIKGVYLRRCGEPIFQEGLSTPLEIDIDISQPEGVFPGYLVEHMCAVFDEGLGAWSTAGVSVKYLITNMSTEMTCLATMSSGLFAALYRVVREEPPNTTTPLPPPPEVDEGLTLGALIAIVGGGTVCLCGCIGSLYVWHKIRSREPVEPEPEEEEEEVPETDSESEIAELPDPDPALTKLRIAAEAGTLTARDILANHSGPMGIRKELVWALDKGYEKKRREAQSKVEWKECFDLYDKDSDGKIKAAELGDVLRSLGLVLTQKEVQELKEEVGSDLVTWEKFKALAAKKPRQPEKQAQALLQAFQVFDQSGSGQVDMKELRHIVTSLGEKLTAKEFEEICKAADLPSAGSLEYKKAGCWHVHVEARQKAKLKTALAARGGGQGRQDLMSAKIRSGQMLALQVKKIEKKRLLLVRQFPAWEAG
ncbi:calA [Symbiodinium natans]|uniref:Calmodulin n=1 Tax=Symbiodinium natans TaxID=878477 RepID=A0A812IA13_9DINO|nr:calA [Symbiodinium natans]